MSLARDTACVYRVSQTREMIGRLELMDRWSLRWVNKLKRFFFDEGIHGSSSSFVQAVQWVR